MSAATKARARVVEPQNRSLVVPRIDAAPWPSLGGQVCAFIEQHLVHGPGDVLGEPAELTDEYRLFIWRAYEVFPAEHPRAGRRRFKRVVLSRRKGLAKTELLAWTALTELDPAAPVRCGGWHRVNDRRGKTAGSSADRELVELGYSHGETVPLGVPVRDPYIPLIAVTEEQSEDLAYGACVAILQECEHGNGYDIGLARITPRDAPGELKALAGAPNARDGARTTFQGFDETHLYVAERPKAAHATMQRNLLKRKKADPWGFEATTMYEPGQDSIAQLAHEYALDVDAGRVADASLYFDHRQASLVHDLSRRRELLRAIEEASGDALDFTDVPALVAAYLEPGADRPTFRRYFLNQRVKGASRWLAPELIERVVAPRRRARKGARVVVSFDGSYSRDSTALLVTTVAARPHVQVERVWEKPRSARGAWRVSHLEVDAAVEEAMNRYDVAELAPDPPGWHKEIEEWEGTYGEVVVRFETNQPARMGPAASIFEEGLKDEAFTIDGTEPMLRHLGNCHVAERRGYRVPVKASADSPEKIDVAVGAVIGVSRATWHFKNPPKKAKSWKLVA